MLPQALLQIPTADETEPIVEHALGVPEIAPVEVLNVPLVELLRSPITTEPRPLSVKFERPNTEEFKVEAVLLKPKAEEPAPEAVLLKPKAEEQAPEAVLLAPKADP